MLVPRCGTAAVSFLPQISGFEADFWAGEPLPPVQGHPAAIPPPQKWIGGSCARHEALARIELSPVG
jgi:hypothetical protein